MPKEVKSHSHAVFLLRPVERSWDILLKNDFSCTISPLCHELKQEEVMFSNGSNKSSVSLFLEKLLLSAERES